jgi:RNA polymerase subunit RPABC4/transcription elongation factor Spt4
MKVTIGNHNTHGNFKGCKRCKAITKHKKGVCVYCESLGREEME